MSESRERVAVHSFKMDVDVLLPEGELRTAARKLNKYYTGKEIVGLDEEVPKELVEVIYRLRIINQVETTATVYSDGSVEIIR